MCCWASKFTNPLFWLPGPAYFTCRVICKCSADFERELLAALSALKAPLTEILLEPELITTGTPEGNTQAALGKRRLAQTCRAAASRPWLIQSPKGGATEVSVALSARRRQSARMPMSIPNSLTSSGGW